jgi:hypothetical protein
MPVLSHVHQLFNAEQCQAYIRTLRWKDRPLQALVGFQGRGVVEAVRPDFCHHILLESLIFQRSQKHAAMLGQGGA